MPKSPVPDKEKLENLGLYLTTKNFSRMLFLMKFIDKF